MRFLNSRTLRYFGQRARELAHNLENAHHPYEERQGGRSWEDYYRRRWQHDKVVRSTHGVNCTGSCSFDVRQGRIIVGGPKDRLSHASPRFPRLRASRLSSRRLGLWYVYSPLRVKYPYIRGKLLEMWKAAKQANNNDPVAAWEAIQSDPAKRKAYQQARGKGGFVRFSWDEASEIIAASLISTIKKHGPDRIFRLHAAARHVHDQLRIRGAVPVHARREYGQLLRLVLRPAPGLPADLGRADRRARERGLVQRGLHHLVGFQPASDPHAGRPLLCRGPVSGH